MEAFKLFEKYSADAIDIRDPTLQQYAGLREAVYPHSFGRHGGKQFAKSGMNIVERLANKLMRGGTGQKLGGKVIRTHGQLQGKKLKALKIIAEAFDIISQKTKQNPYQVLFDALEHAAPREDTTKVRFGGISYQVAVDLSGQRRVDMALKNIALAVIIGSFNKKQPMAVVLADELILGAKNDMNSYSVKKKNETERAAKSSR